MRILLKSVRARGQGLITAGYDLVGYENNADNSRSPAQCYQSILERAKDDDIIAYCHDDVTIHDLNWYDRLADVLLNPDCVAVGFGGATSLGRPDLYRKPFDIWNMARGGYASNQTDAEVHGERFSGDKRVAVLDAFCMAVRVNFLSDVGGWPTQHLTHHCLDLWLGLEAARRHKQVWMTGVSCTHHGGGTSVKPTYSTAKWLQGGTLESDHLLPHKWLYEKYRDVLPLKV